MVLPLPSSTTRTPTSSEISSSFSLKRSKRSPSGSRSALPTTDDQEAGADDDSAVNSVPEITEHRVAEEAAVAAEAVADKDPEGESFLISIKN